MRSWHGMTEEKPHSNHKTARRDVRSTIQDGGRLHISQLAAFAWLMNVQWLQVQGTPADAPVAGGAEAPPMGGKGDAWRPTNDWGAAWSADVWREAGGDGAVNKQKMS